MDEWNRLGDVAGVLIPVLSKGVGRRLSDGGSGMAAGGGAAEARDDCLREATAATAAEHGRINCWRQDQVAGAGQAGGRQTKLLNRRKTKLPDRQME